MLASDGETIQRGAVERRLPIGAEVIPGAGVHFRVWAPRRQNVEVVFEDQAIPVLRLEPENEGYFSGLSPHAPAGSLYRFRLDNSEHLYPDPTSRFQPNGPHGPSQVVDPETFAWTDDRWPGVSAEHQVLYEMHIGTFTREGTWNAAARELPYLADLGVTCIEVMPVADFPGRFGWGYDGVNRFAPTRLYGTPDDFRSFVNRAHAAGVGVILDVVYNHFGPDGNYIREFSQHYFNDKHKNDWGESLNFDGHGSGGVREFFISSARHWIEDYHLDGFRFDATQAIRDSSAEHILAAIARQARASAGDRRIYLIAENEPQNTKIVRPANEGGYGLDAMWNDDFHHSAMVALSGHNEAYYSDYRGAAQEFVSAAKWGYLYQGQRYQWQKTRRGTPMLDLPPTALVNYLQNHDQIGNTARGYRAHQVASPGAYRAMTALLLLSPQTPLLFQGQEFAASSTFHYFADHNPKLNKLICQGRARELSQFPSAATPEIQSCLPDPCDPSTFERSKLDLAERDRPGHADVLKLHKDLLRLRRDEPVFRRVQRRGDVDGAVLSPEAFVLRYFGADGDDRLLVVNLGIDLPLQIAPEPLLAPPAGRRWSILFSSESTKYGGSGTPPLDTEREGWLLPGRCAVVLKPLPAEQGEVTTRVVKSGG